MPTGPHSHPHFLPLRVEAATSKSEQANFYFGSVSESVIYVTIQFLVVEGIHVFRVWAIMGDRRRILWTFFFLQHGCIQSAFRIFFGWYRSLGKGMSTVIFQAIIFIIAVHHGIEYPGGMRWPFSADQRILRYLPKPVIPLLFQGSVLYFIALVLRNGDDLRPIPKSFFKFSVKSIKFL
ncbi:hypothetical protein ARMSODRAFT_979241 [Armillaria solidipes]|uniref:Uncharacterized protein n=1 Tax=Armillaria solidipes TaxID=1076256 RepID=A0A2H3BEE2_9AGAR|nr:hypothetical protein ARMSODRAFT_982128 [Armillaria solidipes]PBK64418.1 hypothetical protein ARMSODRAFT_979241 [Armillaria solidipes]